MHDMRQIPCPMCGRRVTISENSPVPCPSCGVPVSAPAAEPPVAPILADDDSATRVATIPPSEPALAEAAPAVVASAIPVAEPPAPPSAPLSSLSEITDPRTQPASPAEVQQAAYPPATPASAAPAPEQPITQTYHATPTQQPETQAYAHTPTQQPETQTQPYTPVVPPAPQPAQPTSKRNPTLLIVGAVVAVVLLLGIIGAAVVFANRTIQQPPAQPTQTATATATNSVPVGFIQFADAGNVYKVNYPSNWTKTATSGDLNLAIFAGTPAFVPGVFEVEYFKATVDPKTLQDSFFKGPTMSGKVINKQGPTTFALAGESWQRETADITSAGNSQHIVVLTTNHGQYSVVIAYQAAQVAFVDADTHAFQPMLNSFQFVQ